MIFTKCNLKAIWGQIVFRGAIQSRNSNKLDHICKWIDTTKVNILPTSDLKSFVRCKRICSKNRILQCLFDEFSKTKTFGNRSYFEGRFCESSKCMDRFWKYCGKAAVKSSRLAQKQVKGPAKTSFDRRAAKNNRFFRRGVVNSFFAVVSVVLVLRVARRRAWFL